MIKTNVKISRVTLRRECVINSQSLKGAQNEKALDISRLRAESGLNNA
jgi:hypothetical protein